MWAGPRRAPREDTLSKSDCSTGKPICASITADHNPASRSPAGTDHYMSYDLDVSYNPESGSDLEPRQPRGHRDMGRLGRGGATTTTSTYVTRVRSQPAPRLHPRPSPAPGHPRVLAQAIPFGYQGLDFPHLVGNTASPLGLRHRRVGNGFRQGDPKAPKGGTNVAYVKTTYPTSYEDVGDEDISTAGGGLTTTLVTTNAGSVNQLSKLPVPARRRSRNLQVDRGERQAARPVTPASDSTSPRRPSVSRRSTCRSSTTGPCRAARRRAASP